MELENFLHEKMRSFGAATYKKFLGNELIYHWRELVDENISDKIKPVKVERGILYVAVESSAYRDQLKFLEEELIDAINERFSEGEPLVKEIRIAYGVQIPDDKPTPTAQVETSPEDIILTDEEIKRCEERARRIRNEKLRKTVFETLISQAKVQKFRLLNGWHKCLKCDSLCAAEEILCEVCKIKEREAMVNTLFRIFYDAPQLKAWDAQKILLEKMPHMKGECSLDVIESARTSLIQKVAGNVRFGDEESPDVLKLVALEKRLPQDKLTPAIIRRTLIDLQFNLAEQPKLQRYFALKNRK